MSPDFERLAADLLSNGEGVLTRWFPNGRKRGHDFCVGSIHGEKGDSLKVNLTTGAWADFAGSDKGGDLLSLYAALRGLEQWQAYNELGGEPPALAPGSKARGHGGNGATDAERIIVPAPGNGADLHDRSLGEPSLVWEYHDASGQLLGYVARYETDQGKEFRPWTYWEPGTWRQKSWPGKRPLYGLDRLDRAKPILIVEGEKCADAAHSFAGTRYSVVSWPGGAKAWDKANWEPLKGCSCVLWPDNDQAGRDCMAALAKHLGTLSCRSRVIDTASMPEKWDAADADFTLADFEAWLLEHLPSSDLFIDIRTLFKTCEAISWACKGVIPERSVGMLFGGAGAFKSFIAIDYAMHRSYGLAWLGRKTRRGRVAYLAAEGGAGIARRIHAWHRNRSLDWRDCNMVTCLLPLTMTKTSSMIREAIEQAGPDRVTDLIIDTMSQTYEGDENAASEVADYLRTVAADLTKKLDLTSIIIHHCGHTATDRPRGSSALITNVDFLYGLVRDEQEMRATLFCVKQKDGERIKDQEFDLTVQELARDEDGDPITSLAATHLADPQEILQSNEREARAGRGGNYAIFLRLVAAKTGEKEIFLRKEFYELLDGNIDTESRQKAFYRCKHRALSQGLIELLDGAIYSKSV